MATEYKLNYTASDINAKLSVIDGTKAYYDSTKVDERISESIVQSDYSQTDSTQPDYIKNKLGDLIATENVVELVNISALPTAEDADGVYDTYFEHQFTQPTIGDVVQVEIKLPNSENYIIFNNVEVLDNGEDDLFVVVNTNQTNLDTALEEGLVKIDSTLPAFFLYLYDNEIDLISWEDYTGASIVISKTEVVNDYIKLPNEALNFDTTPIESSENLITSGGVYNALQNVGGSGDYVAGNLIEIKDNIISSTLGCGAGTVVSNEVVYTCDANIENALVDALGTYFFYGSSTNDYITAGDIVDVVFTKSESAEPITFSDIEVLLDKNGALAIFINSYYKDIYTIYGEGFVRINEDSIGIVISIKNNEYEIMSTEDCVGANMQIYKMIEIESYTKLPNEALTFDTEPTENSTNLVNSGDLYNVIGDINTVVAQINTLIGGAS